MDVFALVRKLIVLGILLIIVISFFCACFAAYMVYTHTLKRREGKSWGRQISENNPDLQLMWNAGLLWAQQNAQYKKDLAIKSNDGLLLVAEWYDFGFDKTVIIMPGRRECLIYSYYYAVPYKDCGVNVLVIDQRAHGLSEGTYSTIGILEAEDVILWSKLMNSKYNQKAVYLHGVCVGTACSINVIRNPNCPSFIKAVVLDSAPITYKEIFGNHMIEQGHRLWPTFNIIWWWFHYYTKQNVNDSNNLRFAHKVNIPTCFIHGTKDVYCIPEKSVEIYNKIPAKKKEIHWIEGGTHSKLRYKNPNEYDEIIKNFFSSLEK